MRRRLLKLGFFLLLGAIANIAVAWACTLVPQKLTDPYFDIPMCDVESEMFADNRERLLEIGVREMPVDERARLMAAGWRPAAPASPSSFPERQALDAWSTHGFGLTRRDVTETAFSSDLAKMRECAEEVAAGWPMRSFHGRIVNTAPPDGDDEWVACSALLLSKTDPSSSGQMRILPLVPIASGFVVDTILYALILWCAFAAPLALRRQRRARRGLCMHCAYPAGSSVICTECGRPVASRAS